MAKGPKTEKNGQIVKAAEKPADRLVGLLKKMTPEITRALPRHVNPDRMARIAMTALRTTPKLADCTPASFLGAIMQCAQLGLEPNTPLGHAYLIPYGKDCQLIIGYQGFIELAHRSGRVNGVYAHAVHEGDDFEYELGTDPKIEHRPAKDDKREDRPITHVYGVARIKDAEPAFVVLTTGQVNKRRARSAAVKLGRKSPWDTDYEAMAMKSAIRALWKWLPKSSEMARAEALEYAAETGGAQVSVLDEEVGDVLQNAGLLPNGTVEAEGEEVDPDTGEVVPPVCPDCETVMEITEDGEHYHCSKCDRYEPAA